MLFLQLHLFNCARDYVNPILKKCYVFWCLCLLTSLSPAGWWDPRCEVSYIHRRVEPSHHSIDSLIKPSGLNHICGSQLVRKRFASLHWITFTNPYCLSTPLKTHASLVNKHISNNQIQQMSKTHAIISAVSSTPNTQLSESVNLVSTTTNTVQHQDSSVKSSLTYELWVRVRE